MNDIVTTGIYGKLPAYGDFIFRNLKASFINPWDEWLQHFMSASQNQIGENWLNLYLTSPIWRFVLSPGVIDNNVYAGIIMPSVDRVGRYFPITAVNKYNNNINPLSIIVEHDNQFKSMEQYCLSALNGEIDADELVGALSQNQNALVSKYYPSNEIVESNALVYGLPALDANNLQSLIPYLANVALTSDWSSYSLWMTNGSEYVEPVMFSCQGLPPIGGVASMLDGHWQHRNWKVPYKLNLT